LSQSKQRRHSSWIAERSAEVFAVFHEAIEIRALLADSPDEISED